MSLKKHNIFYDIPYSLPCNTHSANLATRRVTRGLEQQPINYMPDYGGVLEMPGSGIKQSGLNHGLPFLKRTYNVKVNCLSTSHGREFESMNDCDRITQAGYLAITHLFRSTNDNNFTSIRAVGQNLYFDTIEKININGQLRSNAIQTINSRQFVHIPYTYRITGLKLRDFARDTLIVKFNQGIKLLKLNENFRLPQTSDDQSDDEIDGNSSDQSAFGFLGSFPAYQSVTTIDACFNTARNILGTLYSDSHKVEIKLYDLMRSQRCFKRISDTLQDDRSLSKIFVTSNHCDRKRSLRSFVPSKPTYESPCQMENDPAHMVHMILTTTNRVALFDPRSDRIMHPYVDRYKISPLFATEKFIKMDFSKRNNDQFYLLSNMKIRVFDRRYLSQPMNSLDHMLSMTDPENVSFEVIDGDSCLPETVCMNASGQLGFVSFDHSQAPLDENTGPLINPKSVHAPYIEPIPVSISGRRSNELHGLCVSTKPIFKDPAIAFSVAQIIKNESLHIRGFKQYGYDENEHEPDIMPAVNDIMMYHSESEDELLPKSCKPCVRNTSLKRRADDSEQTYIDILNEISPVEVDERIQSKRALEKYQQMKTKLQRTI